LLSECCDLVSIPIAFAVPANNLLTPPPILFAGALSLKEDQIQTNTHAPLHASIGLPFTLVELTDAEVLSACLPNLEFIRRGAKLHPSGIDFAIFAYIRDGGEINSRMFAPLDNIPEDPATGSASATLAALLTELLNTPQNLIFTQGFEMGRTSTIFAKTTENPITVTVSGQAVKTMQGTFIL